MKHAFSYIIDRIMIRDLKLAGVVFARDKPTCNSPRECNKVGRVTHFSGTPGLYYCIINGELRKFCNSNT